MLRGHKHADKKNPSGQFLSPTRLNVVASSCLVHRMAAKESGHRSVVSASTFFWAITCDSKARPLQPRDRLRCGPGYRALIGNAK